MSQPLRIGGDHRLRIKSEKRGFDFVVVHRMPKADEVNQYMALALAGGRLDDTEERYKGKLDKRIQLAMALIKDVEGLQAEEGYTVVETFAEWCGPAMHAFSTHIFEKPFDVEVEPDPGKSAAPSVQPLEVVSARSTARRASGLNK